MAAKLQAVKFGGLKKILPLGPPHTPCSWSNSMPGQLDHPQSLTVPLWKDIELLKNILPAKEASSNFGIGFALSK